MKLFFYSIVIFCLSVMAISAQSSTADIEQAVFNELNNVRANPQSYIPYLQEYKKLFKGKNVDFPTYMMMTNEGTAAVDDAIKFLSKASPLPTLTYSSGLAKPAGLQLADIKENYALGHTGKDGSNVPKRVARYGKGGKLGENIMNMFSNPRDIVMHWIIDDGLKGRGHRKNIFDKSFKLVGIAFGLGQKNDPLTVIVLADKFVESTK